MSFLNLLLLLHSVGDWGPFRIRLSVYVARLRVDFWRLWADYLSLVFEVNFGPFFGQFSIADLLVLRDFFDFEGCSGPVFGPLLDRTFARTFQDFWNPVSSPCRFRTAVDTLPIRTLNCTPASI